MAPEGIVDYIKSLDCVHCGLCLETCPTYRMTGVESASPRGRIHMMRALAEGQLGMDASFIDEMERCLLCRNCESVCPSGVKYGSLMEETRAGIEAHRSRTPLEGLTRTFAFENVLPERSTLSLLARLLRLGQQSGLIRAFGPLFGERGRSLRYFPEVPPAKERRPLPLRTPACEPRLGAVAVLPGCVMPELFGRVNRATASVLARVGYDVLVPRDAGCCGSLHAHNGELDLARQLARKTIAAFDELTDAGGAAVPVVVNSAGCSAHMKEYGELLAADVEWAERARAFAARVYDLSEFLAAGALERLAAALGSAGDGERVVAWDDPCHLCHAQGIRSQPRELLDLLPGLRRVDLEDCESCCGSAGIYSFLRPEDSARILEPRLEALEESGAPVLVTANPGCHAQWLGGVARAGLDVEVLHIAELLEQALAAR